MEILNYAGNIFHYAISFVVILSIIVFVHEFGHFFVARRCGVKIDEFSIGFGREIYGWNDKKGTRWKISLWPLGGFVKMHGDASEASTPDANKILTMSEEEKKLSFHYKPLWQKALVVAAGPLSNFIFSILIFTGIFMVYGKVQFDAPPIVNEVVAGSAAETGGLKTGDEILEIDGEKIKNFSDIPRIISGKAEKEVTIVLKRGDETLTKKIAPSLREVDDEKANKVKIGQLGVTSPPKEMRDENSEPLGFFSALGEAVNNVYQQCYGMLKGIKQIIVGDRSSKELGGPVKIMEYSGQSTKKISSSFSCMINGGEGCGKLIRDGFVISLISMTIISTMLGLVNLFPVPMLDGGHLLFYLIEAVTRRKTPEKIQEWSFRAGFAFLIGLMLYATYNDITSFIIKHFNS